MLNAARIIDILIAFHKKETEGKEKEHKRNEENLKGMLHAHTHTHTHTTYKHLHSSEREK